MRPRVFNHSRRVRVQIWPFVFRIVGSHAAKDEIGALSAKTSTATGVLSPDNHELTLLRAVGVRSLHCGRQALTSLHSTKCTTSDEIAILPGGDDLGCGNGASG